MSRYDDDLELERIFTGSDAKDDLSAILHEMKPLIETIAGYIDILMKHYEKDDLKHPSEDLIKWMGEIQFTVEDLKRLRDAAISAWTK